MAGKLTAAHFEVMEKFNLRAWDREHGMDGESVLTARAEEALHDEEVIREINDGLTAEIDRDLGGHLEFELMRDDCKAGVLDFDMDKLLEN